MITEGVDLQVGEVEVFVQVEKAHDKTGQDPSRRNKRESSL